MSDLPMKQEDHPAHNMPDTDSYQVAGTFSSFPPLKNEAPLKEGETRPVVKPAPIQAPMKPK